MNFEEYALKNVEEMKAKEPNAQNMRDVALLELWLNLAHNNVNNKSDNLYTPSAKTTHKEILPAYFAYIENKSKYQLKDATKDKVLYSLKNLLEEMKDVLKTIYRNTDFLEERDLLNEFLEEIKY